MEPQRRRRGPQVVDAVLEAAAQELARVGFAGLSVEVVAAHAGVNKTTVYRRWPTKRELVLAALAAGGAAKTEVPNTGDLRADLFDYLRQVREGLSSPVVRSIFLALLADEPTIASVAAELRARSDARLRQVVKRAVGRGELPADVEQDLLGELLFGALQFRLLFVRDKLASDDYLGRVIDIAVAGVRAPCRRTKPPKPR